MSKLNDIAHKKGYDSVSLAKALHVSQSKMWRVLHGRLKRLDLHFIAKLVMILDCSFEDVISNAKEEK